MKLKKGQILYIDNIKYTIINMIEYKEDTWIWQEYEILDGHYKRKWLTIEEDENNQLEYYIYEEYYGSINMNEIEFIQGNNTYELEEKGTATVTDYFGNVDVDKNESCEYYDYISQDRKTIISIEIWDGEKEQSIGTYIENYRVKITEQIDITEKQVNKNKNKKNIKLFVEIFVIGIIAISFLDEWIDIFGTYTNKSISKYLSKQTTKYTYVTSITNNTNNKKAKVYKSSLSNIDTTVKDIIDGVPEGITETTDSNPNTEEDGIGLQTNKEYAYIYKENKEIYIQVSDKEYVTNSGTMYHSSHSHFYYNTYTSNRNSTVYSNYAYSARQNSINSRTSSGGGTSSGK